MNRAPATIQPLVSSIISQLRAFDRLIAGRRVASLAALGVLAQRDATLLDAWRTFRNAAVHYGDSASSANSLNRLSYLVEDAHPDLGQIFTSTLNPDILQSGGALPELMSLSTVIVDNFDNERRDEFGIWFDAILDEISQGRQVGEVTTPRSLARLMARIAKPEADNEVLDPACGLGATLVEMSQIAPGVGLYGQEVGTLPAALATLRLYLLGLPANVKLGDALRAPARWSGGPSKFDRVICDPPYGLAISAHGDAVLTRRFSHMPTLRSEALFVQHCLENLKPNGRAVLLLPLGFLARRGGDAVYRAKLVEDGCIEGVISLPGGVIPWTDLPSAIVVLRSIRAVDEPVILVDASYLKQIGKRASDRLTPSQVEELLSLYDNPIMRGRAGLITARQLLDNDADLQPHRWLVEKSESAVDLSALFRQAVEAEDRAEIAKRELNKLMAYFKLHT